AADRGGPGARVPLLEPADRQLLDGVARLPLPPHPPQQALGPLQRRWRRKHGARPPRPGAAQLAGDRGPSRRHPGHALGRRCAAGASRDAGRQAGRSGRSGRGKAMSRFEAEELLAQASERSGGLTDFGDESFRPALHVMLLEQSFYAALDAYASVPGYMAWQGRQDHRPAYAYLKKLLQFLQWQKRQRGATAERWVLKTPNHLPTMGALFEVFPDATVIQ